MNNVRGMVEGALFTGIFIVLLLLTIYSPIGIITLYLMPIPFVVYSYRQGIKMGLWVTIASAILSVFIGQIYGMFLGISAGTVGIVMGYLYHKSTPLPAVVGGVITTLVNYIILLILGNYLFDTHIVSDMKATLNASMNAVEGMINNLGMTHNEQSLEMLEAYRTFINNLELLLPFLFIASAVLSVFLTHFFSTKMMKRLRIEIPSFPPFKDWRFPKSIVYYYLLTLIIILLNPSLEILRLIAFNLSPLLQLILLVQGLSFVFYYADHKNLGKKIPVIAVISIFIIPVMGQIFNIIGLVDLTFDIRKKIRG